MKKLLSRRYCLKIFWAFLIVILSSLGIGIFKKIQRVDSNNTDILVTIKPLYGLVKSITKDTLKIELLMDGRTSPHHEQHLSPQQLIQLSQTKILIYVGNSYESFNLIKIFDKYSEKSLIIENFNGLKKLPLRFMGCNQCSNHKHNHNPHHLKNISKIDGHFWLCTENAIIIAQNILKSLIQKWPQHEMDFLKNYQHLIEDIIQTKKSIHSLLEPIKNKNYVIYHDGLQYFDQEFHTQACAVITNTYDLPLNWQNLQIPSIAQCIVVEPQFDHGLVSKIAKKLNKNVITIDYLGTQLKSPQNLYCQIILNIANQFFDALKQ